ncbi:FAD-dependent oxidoreductase [Anaerosalibacter sp. Marseille-P3206]|uniref:FAD-dependent oxidoreductase n=1 Tax=Anaerosalibacter sp. Marseille-P3206 TaxID=1871005 RepID=UPI000BE93739|nr:FAD-dependent oxidoreductase [Anaerosalibacter sp. Marseille-P3206]
MDTVVIIGGGWAGCAASIRAKKMGAKVVLIERTDMLLGLGNVGGIMRNNGRYTATEENIHLGASELFEITDMYSRHKNLDFPGHKHASLYDVTKIEPEVRRLLTNLGIEVLLKKRAIDVIINNRTIEGIVLNDDSVIYGDVFIETTGSTGPMGNCLRYGNGCSMCILRCPTFGPRISISEKSGVDDLMGKKKDGTFGAFSGSCKLNKDSLSFEIRNELDEKGVVVLPVPKEDIHLDKLDKKVCQQYALKEYAENIILLDTGHAKMMTTFYPLEDLRKIQGLENARYEDPYSGGIGNSVRYLSMAPRDNAMKVIGVNNLFCGGEKAGLFVGHTEAITTGSLAGYNSVRMIRGEELLELPRTLAVGDIIAYENEMIQKEEGLRKRYTFAGSDYFIRMKDLNLYSIDRDAIQERVKKNKLLNIYNRI